MRVQVGGIHGADDSGSCGEAINGLAGLKGEKRLEEFLGTDGRHVAVFEARLAVLVTGSRKAGH